MFTVTNAKGDDSLIAAPPVVPPPIQVVYWQNNIQTSNCL